MALPLPTQVDDPLVQQCLDEIAMQFPIQRSDMGKESVGSTQMATSAKGLFPQLVTPGNRHINFGEAIVEWAGGSIESKTVEVEHGLGATPPPGGVQLTPLYVLATRRMFPQLVSTSKTKIALLSVCNDAVPAAGVKQTIHWLAIG